jgi:hypothetical protein
LPALPAASPAGSGALPLGLGAGAVAVMINDHQFPELLQGPLRTWWLHFFATLAASVVTAWVLGYLRNGDGRGSRRLLALACLTPLGVLAAHEFGQWLFPKGERDTFDTLRDLAMNALGTVAGFAILRRYRSVAPAAASSARRRRVRGG